MPHLTNKQRSLFFSAVGAAALTALGVRALRQMRTMSKVRPELRSIAMTAVPPIFPVLVPLMQKAMRKQKAISPIGVRVDEFRIESLTGGSNLRVVRLRRETNAKGGGALLWLHGGGYVVGMPEMDFALLARILESIDITIFSVDYRLAPQDPFPAPLDDAMSALEWLVESGAELGINARNLGVGGISAGGGLAAALAQRACDANIPLSSQLLVYPMLDDRTACRTDTEGRGELLWTPRNNRYGWSAYLGRKPGEEKLPPYAAAARRQRLTGVAPAWIGVGSLDLLYPENVAYAERLRADGVHCVLEVVADAPHGFDHFRFETAAARNFHDSMIGFLASACASNSADPCLG